MLRVPTWRPGWLRNISAAQASMLVAMAALIAPLILFLGASWIAYDENERQAEERIRRALDLLYVNVQTTFQTEYLVAAHASELLEDHSNADIRASEGRFHDQLARLIENLPQVDNVLVLDEKGEAIVAAKLFPLPLHARFDDREFFPAHLSGVPHFLSGVVHGRLRNQEIFQYSERRQKRDGTFNGVIAVSISPAYFARQFARLSDAPGFFASIVHEDGQILARYPEAAVTRLGPDTGFERAINNQPWEGTYTVDSGAVDGVARFIMYRKLVDLPVYVVHGWPLATIRQIWIARMAPHLIFGIPATLGLFALALLASRRAAQQARTLAALGEEQARREIAEESLRQSHKMNAIGQLTAGIAHDFNNLLTGIGGALEMAGRRLSQPSPEVVRFLELAKSGVMRATTLTQRLLAFARQAPLQIESIDANKLVSGMSELLRRTLGETVEIETILAGGLWRAEADAVQLESAILNLAINARDAMPRGGTLTIETANAHLDDAYSRANIDALPGQYVMIAVSDTGGGMDQETIARACEPFFTTKQRGQGTGLGLSMTFGYVKQVGGHLKIYSELGQGTTVKLYLPRATNEVTEASDMAPAPARAGNGGPVVLVVEDDPVVREFAVSACRDIGCSVFQAADAREALAVLSANEEIALLFTDIGLPGGMNGRQLAEVATRQRPSLKVLYTTGYTANAIVHHGVLDAGVNFIGKPFSVEGLSAKIRSMGF